MVVATRLLLPQEHVQKRALRLLSIASGVSAADDDVEDADFGVATKQLVDLLEDHPKKDLV